jgi:hypothetical protein
LTANTRGQTAGRGDLAGGYVSGRWLTVGQVFDSLTPFPMAKSKPKSQFRSGGVPTQGTSDRVLLAQLTTRRQIATSFFMWSCFAWLGWRLSLFLIALAGTETLADIELAFLANVNVYTVITFTFGLTGVAYGAYERHVRQKQIRRLEGRIRELEKMIDPKRTSSQLTKEGRSRPED